MCEELGDKIAAVANLESQIGVDGGTLQGADGRLFTRAATVGLASGNHTVTLGRQLNMTAFTIHDAMMIGPALHSIASINGYLGTTRSDNAVAYQGRFGRSLWA